ncbi:hypothetical protein [Streptomyces sp. V4I2]|uniref:hypothetical protein n=1 Tax=Streptomyces sp. V4I2 TaxID=3042280 RepID=UPI0027884E78|nr:hypothetical protein [Streptomyces sp. V4I2]MDQ1047855.1 hypothetical protein [Streptomyces sp. V4I2]
MDADASNARHEHVIDWLEQSADLPHLIARVSELVHRLGYDPQDLIVLPRGELDRRELGAYSAAWADVVAEQMPGIRRAYEERITAAYFEGHEDARTGRRPRRTGRPEDARGGEVIPLPYLQLLRPPSEVTRVEERGERERSVADENEQSPEPEPELEPGPGPGPGPVSVPAADILLSARDVRETSPAVERRPVVRRNGRPSVPPLKRAADTGALRDRSRRQQEQPDPQVPRDEDRPRLSDKARVLADELEGKGRTSGRGRDEKDEQTPGPR